ncbi:PREDICTED: testis- and ovary-specific PAZ domain-containing protein 1 isoform X1 [Gavialis gangeticus]|uniref:testis- and ovary-specific PAZ domain-containing protein 1 isoform X1 n=1 Tax=Gavialis gangeticus TaxID=94835 RepID=UPI00092F3BE3|nr:PREDICTED: testis- and ovary-specific PAZ domain-containing protein 1 isoform X1 [Gavialis gangeticus]
MGLQESTESPKRRSKHSMVVPTMIVPYEGAGNTIKRGKLSATNLQPINLSLQGGERTVGKRARSSSVKLWQSGSQNEAEILEKASKSFSEGGRLSENKKSSSPERWVTEYVEERLMPSRVSLTGTTRGNRQGKLDKQQASGQEVISAPTNDLFINRLEDDGERQTDGDEETVVSSELKLKIRKPTKKKGMDLNEVSDAQVEKPLETAQNTAKESSVRTSSLVAYSESFQLPQSDGTQSKRSAPRCLARGSAVDCNRTKNKITKIKCLQRLTVQTAENKLTTSKSIECKDECREALKQHNSLLSIAEKNPVVALHDCHYLNTFVKSSVDGSNNSYKIDSGFLHVLHSKTVCPGRVTGQSGMNAVQAERWCAQGIISFDEEGTCQNREKCFSCSLNRNKCFRERKWSSGEKPRKKVKLFERTEKLATQNVLPGRVNSECELHTENKTLATVSLAVLGELNSNKTCLSSSCDLISNAHVENNTKKALNSLPKPVSRKMCMKPGAIEDRFEKNLQLPEAAQREKSFFNAESMAPQDHSNLKSPGVIRLVSDISNCCSDSGSCQKKLLNEKLFKKPEKLQVFSCQRAIPMTGKNVWPRESCARTSVWFPKKDKSIIEKKNSLTSFQGCSHQNTETLRGMDVTDNSKQLDLHMSMTEINKPNACKITDSNTECLASVAILESSLSDINGALRVTKDENLELSLDKGRSSMTFNSGSVQEGKVTLNLSGKQKQDKNKGALKAKNVAMTSQDSMCADNVGKMICNPEMPVTKQTQEFPGLVRMLSTGNLSNFKIPLLRNKNESRKVDYIRSFERETYSPLELLDNSAATPVRQNRTKENSPLVYSDFFLATAKETAYQITNKDFGNDGSERLSDEKKRLAEHVSACPWDFPERELMSPTSEGAFGTEFREKSNVADHSSKIVKHSTSSEVFVNDGKKLKEKPTQSSSTNFPDVLKAYEDDILVIDVIQDDPDLFGTTNEGEFELDCETEITKHGNILTSVEKQNFTPKFHNLQENKDSNYYHGDSPIQESGTLQPIADSCDSLITANEINKHDSSRGSSPLGGVTEESSEDGQLTESDEHTKGSNADEKYRFSGRSSVKEEKDSIYEKSSDSECAEFVSPDLSLGLQLPCLEVKAHHGSTVQKPGMNDFRYSGKCPLLPHPNSNCYEPWKMDKSVPVSYSIQKILEIELPRKYCRFYFNTLRGCERAECWFWHIPEQGDEKICMAVLRTYININETSLLQRAVQIFMNYYREVTPGVHFDLQVLNDLLIALLKHCLLKEVFLLLNVGIMIKRLPPIDVILKVLEHVASTNIREAVPTLIDAFCKLFDAGMGFESEHFNYIVKFLHQLQVSSQEINAILNIKSRFQAKQFKKNWLCDINMAIAEIQHCKEKSDWSSLGTLYINVRMGCQNFGDLQKLTLCIAEILTRDSTEERPGVPFCEFAETVIKNPQHNEGDKIFLGRIGISVMYSYHRVLQWSKGRKVLDKLHEFQIYFTSLKGLTGPERLASRCQIVNVAAEIFLKSGSLDGATWVLRDSEWVIDTAVWPCDRMDVLSRHNLLCALACEYLTKSQYRQTFEILQNLPGFQTCCDTLDVSQYSLLFNKLLDACIESKSLGVSSSVIDFMFSKKVPIDFTLLRGLITTLGRSCLWLKARTYYKSALSLGCYPPLEGNLYRKLLLIPSYMSEVEMLLAIEIFLVSNASNIQSPGATSQTLQIILKRCEEHKVQSKDDYRTAMDRVILAARISDPKLFLKHMTMNINMEQVYSLEHNSALKWLKENMKWAGKVWLFQ